MPRLENDDFQNLDHEKLVRLRPNLYLGSTSNDPRNEMMFDTKTGKLVYDIVANSEAERQTFREGLTNAVDNVRRYAADGHIAPPIIIEVINDEEIPLISITNGGYAPLIEKKDETDVWIPFMIFGKLISGSNYTKGKTEVGGANGFGVKLLNIFSSLFEVEIINTHNKKKWFQHFESFISEDPLIQDSKAKTDSVTIRYRLDGTLGVPNIDFYAFDILCASLSVPEIRLKIDDVSTVFKRNSVLDWLKYYPIEIKPLLSWKNGKNEIVIADIPSDFSFPNAQGWINGLPCSKGYHIATAKGCFATAFEAIMKTDRTLAEKIEKNRPSPAMLKDSVLVLVKVEVLDPEFGSGQIKDSFVGIRDSKEKPNLALDNPKWGDWKKSHLMEKLNKFWDGEQEKEFKKTDGTKTKNINMDKYTPANWAGGKKSNQASLIGVEGTSANGYAEWLVSFYPDGNNRFGRFEFRGKVINTAKADAEAIIGNKEITNLKKALGLREGLDYTIPENRDTLRYGESFIILTDQDLDGTHIRGLILTFFHERFPSLLKCGYVKGFHSPIIRVNISKKNDSLRFYRWNAYDTWLNENDANKKAKTKYFKGLGSSTEADIKEDCSFNNHAVTYTLDDEAPNSLVLAFNPEQTDERKDWIAEDLPNPVDLVEGEQSITNLIRMDLIYFFHQAVIRAIPQLEDGLKEVQRKLLWCLYDSKKITKVPTLGSKAITDSKYHHADMDKPLIKMAQTFAGTNNVPFFTGEGNFGNRGNRKAAASRYISAKISDITHKVYPKVDFPLYKLREEEGELIEPESMFPIVPPTLLNGAWGVGSGFSTFIPCFDPIAVIENVRRNINGQEYLDMVPYYQNYNGTIELKEGGFTSCGKVKRIGSEWVITELPLFEKTNKYESWLRELIERKIVRQVTRGDVGPSKVHLSTIGPAPNALRHLVLDETLDEKDDDFIPYSEDEGLEYRFFKLKRNHSMKNMVLIHKDRPKRYASIEEIISDFVEWRTPIYIRRKILLLADLSKEIPFLAQKIKLLKIISEKKVDIRDDDFVEKAIKIDKTLDQEIIEDILSKNMIKALRPQEIGKLEKKLEELKEKYDIIDSKKPTDLWLADLADLEKSL